MRRADRLFMLIEKLRPGRLTTAKALAEALEVSERTIYRDMAHLIGAGLPIDGAAGAGYMMRPGYDLPPMMFSEEEIVALTAGARMVSAFGGAQMARGANSALDKINNVLPEGIRSRAEQVGIHTSRAGNLSTELRAAIDELEAACQASRRVRVSYRDELGATTDRMLRPLGLWFWGQVWTLVAWCELRRDFRMFRLDRILAAECLEVFEPEPGQRLEDFYASEATRSTSTRGTKK